MVTLTDVWPRKPVARYKLGLRKLGRDFCAVAENSVEI